MFSYSPESFSLYALMFTTVGSVWTFAWWLSNKFNSLLVTLNSKIDSVAGIILDKLEYHERHDDDRFTNMFRELSDLRVRNATADALLLRKHPVAHED